MYVDSWIIFGGRRVYYDPVVLMSKMFMMISSNKKTSQLSLFYQQKCFNAITFLIMKEKKKS